MSTALSCFLQACELVNKSDGTRADNSAAKPVKTLRLVADGKAVCQNLLIDDIEDGNVTIPPTDNRGGFWYTYKDSVGSTLAPSGPYVQASSGARSSRGAAHISGTTATSGVVYAGLGLYFTKTQLPYDLSAASGFCFFAKGSGLARVALSDVNTVPEGGVCKACYNNFGKDFELGSDWQEYCFKFSQLAQSPYWGDPVDAFAANAAFGIQWLTAAPGANYELWVDDVRLTCD